MARESWRHTDDLRDVGSPSMTIQIKSIVLYNHSGETRELALQPGRVNIITGKSLTGKSAIIDIVDYCLGRSMFSVAEGVIRETVAWYAVVLQAGEGTQLAVAKPAPAEGAIQQSQCYL